MPLFNHNIDVFSIDNDERIAYINYLHVVEGAITQAFTFEYKKKLDETGEELLVRTVGHVEDHVLSPLGLRLFYIPAIGVHESFRRVPAVEGADGLPAAQMALAGGQIAGVEIVPIGKEDQVDAQDLLRGHHAASVLAAVHELHPVEARKGRQQVRPVPIAVQVLAVGGEIEGALHGSTRSRRTTFVSSRPSGPQAASQRNPWQFFRCQL